MYQNITLLGSTGSIGRQTLDVVRKLGIKVCALTANNSIKLLEEQAREFKPRAVCIADENKYLELKNNLADTDIKVLGGNDGILECAKLSESDVVVNAIVGIAGLRPTLEAISAKKDIAITPCAAEHPMSFKVPDRLLTDGQCRMMINGIQFIQVLLEANGLAAGKDHQFKGRYDAEKNAVIISLEKDEQSALSPQKCTT